MSAIPCPVCGELRKCMQNVSSDGWHNPECWSCKDPGWITPHDSENPLDGYHRAAELARVEVEGVVICGLIQASCICTREPDHPDDFHECARPGCGGRWREVDGQLEPVRFPYADGRGPVTDARYGLTPEPYVPEPT